MKQDNNSEKELYTLVPSQISPNPLRKRDGNSSPQSETNSSFSAESSGLFCAEPVLNFQNLLEKRHGSVLGHEIILKSEHFFKGMNKVEGELKLFGAPNFRSTNLNIYGAAQPSSAGLATILRVLGCAPCDHTTTDSSEILFNNSEKSRKRTIWFSTREEPIVYVNDTPFVLRDLSSPFVNIKSYSGITSNRLEAVENRLKINILAEAKRNHGLLLVHDEQDNHDIIPCLISVDSVKTPKEIMEDVRSMGFAVDYYRIPVSHEQSPTDPYIDEYFKVFAVTPTDWPVVFSYGMGIGRTTYGMVIGLLIRRAQMIKSSGVDPFQLKSSVNSSTSLDFGLKSRTMLRLVYILEQGLKSKQSPQSAIEWILDRSESIDKLEAAINGNYMVINDLVRVLNDGAFCKQVVDSAIDRCDTVVNLREHILLYRVRSVIQNGQHSCLDTGLGFLERYFSLISFCQYVEEQVEGSVSFETFQNWMENHKEIWKMLTYLRSSSNKLKAFRPLEELKLNNDSESASQSATLKAFRSPQLKSTVSEDIAVVQGRSGTVLGPNTILKIDHWQDTSGSISSIIDTELLYKEHLIVSGAPNFRKIQLDAISPNQIYAVAQPTQVALEQILDIVSTTLPTPRRIVWINVREEPILYINGEPYVLRDQYASLRNIKAYTGIAASRLEQMELRLKEDVLAEGRSHLGRILLHSEGSERDLLPIWESVRNVSTMQDLFSLNSNLCRKYPHLEYYRVPITAEEAPEPADFDRILKILTSEHEHNFVHGSVFIFNCQMGLGRSTMGSVIGLEILAPPACELNSPPGSLVHYKIITNLLRLLKDGNEAKKRVDYFIDQAGEYLNLRVTIEEYRKAASRCTDDQRNCRKLVNKGIQCLKRYTLLILFQAYLLEFTGESFEDWIARHQEFANLFHELENKEIQGLTVLSEIEVPPVKVPGSSTLSRSNSEHKIHAKLNEVKSVVAGRLGSVLAPLTILKFDHFIGCQKGSLPERIDGAPNFRQVPIDSKSNVKICGLAMPTISAIERVLKRISCVPGENRKCLWISMREEPVIFVNGQPFVLRIVKDPIANLEMTGIISERVELMECRLKAEAESEASRYGNRLLLHEEEQIPGTPPKFEIVPEWEEIDRLESPAEVYQKIIETGKYPLTYVRVPVTDEQAPIPNVFDELVQLISAEKYTDFIFNCQMGRGRTSTGMIITMLYHRVLCPVIDDLALEKCYEQQQDEEYSSAICSTKYLRGEYKIIHQLCGLLDRGQEAKRLADNCINSCAQMQNLREAIYDYKLKLSSPNLSTEHANEIETRGLHYLIRYFYLVVFAEYLLEKLNKKTGKFEKTFLNWLSERREVTNLTLKSNLSFD